MSAVWELEKILVKWSQREEMNYSHDSLNFNLRQTGRLVDFTAFIIIDAQKLFPFPVFFRWMHNFFLDCPGIFMNFNDSRKVVSSTVNQLRSRGAQSSFF